MTPSKAPRKADAVLASYHLAGSVRTNTIIADPTGGLSRLHARVSRGFAERVWVRARREDARRKIGNGLRAIDTSAPLHDQVTAWMFPTGVTTHVLLVAALRNPTVRPRYLAARDVLADDGHASLYPVLLELLGCAHLSRHRVAHHLHALTRTFDATAAVARTPFFFSSDITPWHDRSRSTGAAFARRHKILAAGAPDLQHSLVPAFEAAVADLGITSTSDILHRADEVIRFLPRLWETTEAILPANPGISN